jgi:hypothetical protein
MSDEDDLPEALPAQGRPKPPCPHCGGTDLARGVSVALSNETGSVGLRYRASGEFLGLYVTGTEPLRATVCRECGTIVRLSVKEPDRDWV